MESTADYLGSRATQGDMTQMKVLVAGASGAIGRPLTRQLIAHGHEVLGLARDPSDGSALKALGATAVVADALDRESLLRAVDGHSADAIINELTALKKPPTQHHDMARTNRLRMEATANLMAAGEVLGSSRFLTQSMIFGYGYRDHGAEVLTEEAPFGQVAGDRSDPHVAAMLSTEQQAFRANHGIALRYGLFYGEDAGQLRLLLAKRRLPVINGGCLGWTHHHDAAAATVAALERGRAGQAYNIVDDLPASWREVFSAMADAFNMPRPWNVPGWLMRLFAPYAASFAIDTSMRVSNSKARTELGWAPEYPTYREGIQAMASAL
jgi:nucleoside-diphosphate-sugar epimerase